MPYLSFYISLPDNSSGTQQSTKCFCTKFSYHPTFTIKCRSREDDRLGKQTWIFAENESLGLENQGPKSNGRNIWIVEASGLWRSSIGGLADQSLPRRRSLKRAVRNPNGKSPICYQRQPRREKRRSAIRFSGREKCRRRPRSSSATRGVEAHGRRQPLLCGWGF